MQDTFNDKMKSVVTKANDLLDAIDNVYDVLCCEGESWDNKNDEKFRIGKGWISNSE